MRYVLLMHLDSEVAERTTPEEADAEVAAYAEITEQLGVTGVLLGGEALMPARTATMVQVRGNHRLTEPCGTVGSRWRLVSLDRSRGHLRLPRRPGRR